MGSNLHNLGNHLGSNLHNLHYQECRFDPFGFFQDSGIAQTRSPTWDLHQSRTESRRSVGHGPQASCAAWYDEQVAERSRSRICQRTVGEDSLPGYGPVTSSNRPVRTRMPGGVGAGGLRPPATRLGHHFLVAHRLIRIQCIWIGIFGLDFIIFSGFLAFLIYLAVFISCFH